MSPTNDKGPALGPFHLDRGGDLSELRRALEDKGFTEAAVAETVLTDPSGKPIDISAVLRRTAKPSPIHTLVRLFVAARAVPLTAAREALAPVELERLYEVGLLVPCAEGVRAEAALMPFEDWMLLRDFWPDFTPEATPHDFVLGVGPTSQIVVNMTVRRQGELALDLGAGSGILSLYAARHARQVIGTDTNARALNFAAINARLNGLSNIELRQGNTYEPVADSRFDLIIANPPFVISPQSAYEYRDSGLSGDTLSERVIRGAPARLCDDGYCTVLFDWYHENEEDWARRPTEWLQPSGCDAWLLCFSTWDPIGYASNWLRQETADPDRRSQLLQEWLAYYERLGIGTISSGAVVLRRRAGGQNWIRAEKAPAVRPESSCSDQIQRVFAAADLLEELDDERELLEQTFVLTEDHQLEHFLHAEDGSWNVRRAQLRQTRGFEFVGNVDRLVGTILAGCNGQHTLRELAADLAAGLKMDADQILPACLNVIRTLLQSGFLYVPRSDAPRSYR